MSTIRIALAQINTTVGAFTDNTVKIITHIERARAAGADIVAFPELALPGYPPEDLLLKPQFITSNLRALEEIIVASTGIVTIVGFVNKTADIHNAAAIICDGELKGVYHKQFLPNYAVFDEFRLGDDRCTTNGVVRFRTIPAAGVPKALPQGCSSEIVCRRQSSRTTQPMQPMERHRWRVRGTFSATSTEVRSSPN